MKSLFKTCLFLYVLLVASGACIMAWSTFIGFNSSTVVGALFFDMTWAQVFISPIIIILAFLQVFVLIALFFGSIIFVSLKTIGSNILGVRKSS
jgi:hypothetical protein